MIPPVMPAPTFAIRLKAVWMFSLGASAGNMIPPRRAMIRDAMASRRTILICGGTVPGETMGGSAVLAGTAESALNDGFAIPEDTVELQCRAWNVASLLATDTAKVPRLLQATDGDAALFFAAKLPGKRPPSVDKVNRMGAP
jgi:type IV secretion system protein VirB11